MAVLKKYWRNGMGEALLDFADEWARKKKMRRLNLTVWINHKGAIQLYEKAGFKKEGQLKDHGIINKKYVDMVCMGKILK